MKAIRVSPQLLLALLGGCVPPPGAPSPAPPPPAPHPVSRPALQQPQAPVAAPADWRDAPQTPGAWRWSAASGRSTASYAVPGRPAVASLTCDAANRATILWTNADGSGPEPLVITTTGLRRVLTANPVRTGGMAVALPARDALLDATAFSRGRFMLETGGAAPLYLPAWPELSRVIEDCR